MVTELGGLKDLNVSICRPIDKPLQAIHKKGISFSKRDGGAIPKVGMSNGFEFENKTLLLETNPSLFDDDGIGKTQPGTCHYLKS